VHVDSMAWSHARVQESFVCLTKRLSANVT
jgi:hypothetical protein